MNWTVSPEDHALLVKLAERAQANLGTVRLDTLMDLTAAHANGNPLDLPGLLTSRLEDFAHDVFGIACRLNHDTGGLQDHFRPRYSREKSACTLLTPACKRD